MNIERLQHLRRVVKAAPAERFDMGGFNARKPCGTAHCAAGWFALDPWAQANTDILRIVRIGPDQIVRQVDPYLTHAALATLFEISHKQTDVLFYDFWASKAMIITRIDGLIRTAAAKAKRTKKLQVTEV